MLMGTCGVDPALAADVFLSERWRRIEELYHAAQAQPAAERSAFLNKVCEGDAELRREVELLLVQPASGTQQWSKDVLPDGKTVAFAERTAHGNFDIMLLPLTGSATRSPLLTSRFDKPDARFSPDGQAVSFSSNESGRYEVYVAPLSATGTKVPVSSAGGTRARWSRETGELFYLAADRQIMTVPIRTTPSLEVGRPAPLLPCRPGGCGATLRCLRTASDSFR